MDRRIVLVVACCATLFVSAQEKLMPLTLRDAVLKAGTDLAPERLPQLAWVKDAETYSFVKRDTLWENGVGKMMDQAAATLTDLNRDLPDSAKLKSFPPITWESATRFRFAHNSHIYTWDRGRRLLNARVRLLPDAANEDITDKGRVAYTVENDLYIGLPGESQAVRVTSDGADGIVNGGSQVHRNEYGIEKGTFWSPSGEKLAFYRMDESMVTPYQLEDINSKPSTFKKIRYPMAGQSSHQVQVGIFDMRTRKTLFLNTGEPLDQYLTNIAWGPDEKHLYIVHLDRATTKARLVEYDLATGNATRTVLEESSERYVEPLVPMRFLKRDANQFIWTSDRDGWTHLYLYDLRTGLVRQLTTGNWCVKNIVGFDAKESGVVVEGTAVGEGFTGAGAIETHSIVWN
ncbi:MAG: DPP IV N-terminal domain-containing protein [Flavobacteriales bacterium]|nr:DPP IV N-terminal domain-containing protein [Flavobacteriales bacterium]